MTNQLITQQIYRFISYLDDRAGESPLLSRSSPLASSSSLQNTPVKTSTAGLSALVASSASNRSDSPMSGSDKNAAGRDVDVLSDEDDDEDMSDHERKTEDKVNNNKEEANTANLAASLMPGLAGLASLNAAEGAEGGRQLNNVYGLIGNIQALLKMAVENAKQDDRSSGTPSESNPDNSKDIGSSDLSVKKKMEEMKKDIQIYVKRIKKEKRHRRKLQEQLEQETKRRVQVCLKFCFKM